MNNDSITKTFFHMLGIYVVGAIMGASLIMAGLIAYVMAALEYKNMKIMTCL